MTYTCRRCKQTFCSTHRLPETHDCPALVYEKMSEGWFADRDERPIIRRESKWDRPKAMDERDIGRVGGDGKPIKTSSSPGVNEDGSLDWSNRTPQSDTGSVSDKPSFADRIKSRWPSVKRRLKRTQWKLKWKAKRTMNRLVSLCLSLAKVAVAIFVIIAVASFSAGLLDGGSIPVLSGSNATETTPIPDESTAIPESKGKSYVSSDDLDTHRIELLIFERLNEERQKRGLSPVEYDLELQAIARYHSKDMAESGYFAHDSPDGESLKARYQKFGYNCKVPVGGNAYMTGSENIAQTYHDENVVGAGYLATEQELADGLMDQWMNSTGHRKNILTPEWNNIGVGVYIIEESGGTAVYATQNFC
ncbi:hypothetical protein BM92_13275 [Haloferax mediterranei ATCC 33500]|uniref:AN1-type domain-containing protein n=3 Tax=Haloferax TaxID=2251 RepID=A0A059TXQ2_HALMT|nr:CAP domain-containing protein [Haloferax mediterranei]AHZ23552.1 hypothetical protein BM92_13275 [Haloferax mediterranei ATCC 33500]